MAKRQKRGTKKIKAAVRRLKKAKVPIFATGRQRKS